MIWYSLSSPRPSNRSAKVAQAWIGGARQQADSHSDSRAPILDSTRCYYYMIDHPLYSPDLAPADSPLFSFKTRIERYSFWRSPWHSEECDSDSISDSFGGFIWKLSEAFVPAAVYWEGRGLFRRPIIFCAILLFFYSFLLSSDNIHQTFWTDFVFYACLLHLLSIC